MKFLVHLLALYCLATHAQQTYKEPAPEYVIEFDPTAYDDWLPINPGHGTFHDRNSSVTPWQPWPYSPAPYPRPPICGVERPEPQREFWLANLRAAREGTSPFLVDGQDYKVFRNVKDYGARGDGETDDTDAFNRAITDQSRMAGGKGAGGSTGQPALIYIPPGVYSISSSIQLFIDTQVIGDAIQPPVIRASSIMRNNTVMIEGYDFGQPSTTNFYIGLRNVVIDTSGADPEDTIYGLNWAVSQATNLINVNFTMPEDSNHIGIEMDGGDSGGGSGLFMGDLAFEGGLIGIRFNNQQYSMKNLKFRNVRTGIAIQHVFVLTMQGIECENVGICVDMGPLDVAGSISLIDSRCDTCGIVVNGTSSILLENIEVTNSGPTLKVNGTSRQLGSLVGKTYAEGNVYQGNSKDSKAANGTFLKYTDRGTLAGPDGKYFTKPQPQYIDYPASAFASVKDAGAKGDGITDDTKALQQALLSNANCKITYFPHGVYLVTSTLYIPPGSRLVGQVWSTLTASGPFFNSTAHPQPMLQIGKPNETGLVEITDLLFTVSDILPGTILVEVNMSDGGSSQPGSVSLHNSHYRLGGAADSRLETACQTSSNPCPAAFLVLHLAETSSTYIENAWLWSADHDLDGTYNQQIGTGRGLLVESKAATWLLGTGSEHHTLYAYQFANAQNVFAALMQVETPYWQPSPRAPAPWTPDSTWQDPDFENCKAGNVTQCYMQWAMRVVGVETERVVVYGTAFWVFFNGPDYGACEGPGGSCQVNAVDLGLEAEGNGGLVVYQLNTKGMQFMVAEGGKGVIEQDRNNGSWGGVLAAWVG